MIGFIAHSAQSQVNINVNIGSQPAWGPVGYDRVDYYYLPEIESYYNVPSRQFIYLSNGNWVFATSLPTRYRNYDLYSGYKVVINSPRPYLHFRDHRVRYSKYKHNRSQSIIYRSNNPRYYIVKGHPRYRHHDDDDDDRYDRSRYASYDRDYRGNYRGHKGKGHGNGKNKERD
ncbi:hypothetical protein PBAC_23340 [Pedobacter glucosidilyticus]|nr:hypothetical protein PBAC_23340 [Pedobacter glucosidilyticus]